MRLATLRRMLYHNHREKVTVHILRTMWYMGIDSNIKMRRLGRNKMSDAYVECLVKQKQSAMGKFLKVVLIVLTVIFGLLTFIGFVPAMIVAVLTGVGAYFVNLHTDLEYEYLYLDKELTVDKVMAKSKRKRVATYSLDRMEVLAPIKSYHLDNFKNRNVKVKDYSVGEELQPDKRFAMYYEGGEKILLNPSEELVKVMRNASPRKVFAD